MDSRERLLDLLATRATEGLPADESIELEQALAGQGELGVDDFDLAAAAAYLAFDAAATPTEPMPDGVKQRILARLAS